MLAASSWERAHVSAATAKEALASNPRLPLIGTAAGLYAVGVLAMLTVGQSPMARVTFLASMALTGASLLRRPWLEATARRHLRLVALCVPLAASLLVMEAANREQPYGHYWWWFALWLGSILAVPLIIGGERLKHVRLGRKHAAAALIVSGLLAIALLVRVPAIGSAPEPFSGDEGNFLLAGLRVVQGEEDNMFRSGTQGASNLYFFYIAAFERLGGLTPAWVRLSSALLGAAGVAVLYLFLRDVFDRRVALAGGLFLALYHLHIHFSRVSLANIGDPLILTLAAWFAYRATRDGKPIDYALAGGCIGFTMYAWASSRLVPFEVALLWGWVILSRRRFPGWFPGLVVAPVAFLVVAAPIGKWWLDHPDEFNTRLNAVGIHQSSAGRESWYDQERAKGRSAPDIYLAQLRDSIDLTLTKEEFAPQYRTEIGLVGRFPAIFLALGIVIAVARVREPRYFLLLLLFAAPIVTGGMLTIPPPQSNRLFPLVPAVAGLIAVGIAGLVGLGARWLRTAKWGLIAGLAVAAATPGLWYYFVEYPDRERYSDGNTRLVHAMADVVDAEVPRGSLIYWMPGGDVGPGHAALDYRLLEYVVVVPRDDGSVARVQNQLRHPRDPKLAALVFSGSALGSVDQWVARCPGGHRIDATTRGRSFAIYTVERSSCAVTRE
jgi:hypothetical protein